MFSCGGLLHDRSQTAYGVRPQIPGKDTVQKLLGYFVYRYCFTVDFLKCCPLFFGFIDVFRKNGF